MTENNTEVPSSESEETHEEEVSPSIPVEAEWKEYSVDPTPYTNFTREIMQEVDGEKVHLFLRLPNQWQHQKIRNHAAAAKARMVMRLKDPESDVSAIVAEKMTGFDEVTDDEIIQWLLNQHTPQILLTCQLELELMEDHDADGRPYQPWENAREQQERYAIMVSRDETDTEEFKKLEEYILRYAEALEEKAKEHLAPKESVYAALDREGLLARCAKALKNGMTMDEYINAYNQWQIYYGTRNPNKPSKLFFKNVEELFDAPSGLVELLTEEFGRLDALKAAELGKAERATSLLASLERYEI